MGVIRQSYKKLSAFLLLTSFIMNLGFGIVGAAYAKSPDHNQNFFDALPICTVDGITYVSLDETEPSKSPHDTSLFACNLCYVLSAASLIGTFDENKISIEGVVHYEEPLFFKAHFKPVAKAYYTPYQGHSPPVFFPLI